MAEDLVVYVGEQRAIKHVVEDHENAFLVSAATITIYKPAGTVDTGPVAMTWTPVTSANRVTLSYVWNTTGKTPGDYTYLVLYTAGGETLGIKGEIAVVPVTSKLDAYVKRAIEWAMETPVGEDLRGMSNAYVRKHCQAAAREYSIWRPRPMVTDVTLAAATFEYTLPLGWVNENSSFEQVEYPVNDTLQDRTWLARNQWEVDEGRGKWRLLDATPSAGEKARIYWATAHTLNDATNTIPAQDFEAVAMYAGGLCLLALANKASHSAAPVVDADIASYRTRQQQYLQQARVLMEGARKSWGQRQQPHECVWEYMQDHGRIVYPPYS